MITAYQFQPYDVLQSQNGPNGSWQDFMTLRTAGESSDAQARVLMGSWDGRPLAFRIVRRGDVVCQLLDVPAAAVTEAAPEAPARENPWVRFNRIMREVRDGAETPAEDIRNALAILDTLDPNSAALDEVASRLASALRKLENPATGRVGAGIDTVAAHPGVPASLYMMSR